MQRKTMERSASQAFVLQNMDMKPIVSLLSFRSDPGALPVEAKGVVNDPGFKTLPMFKKKEITIFVKYMNESGDLSDSLKRLGFNQEFDIEIMRDLIQKLSRNANDQPLVSLQFLFLCLSFLASDESSWTVPVLRALIDGLSNLVPTAFLLQARGIFLTLAVRLLNFPGHRLEMEDFVTLHKFYMMDVQMPPSAFGLLNSILVTGLKRTEEPMIGQQSVVFLAGLLQDGRVVLSKRKWDSVLQATEHLVLKLDSSTISIIFKMATFYDSELMVKFFRRFPTLFFDKIVSGEVTTKIEEMLEAKGSHTLADWERLEKGGDTVLPPPSMFNGSLAPKKLIPSSVLLFATALPVLLKSTCEKNIRAFEETVSELVPSMKDSEYEVDLILFFVGFVPYFGHSYALEMMNVLTKSSLFSTTVTVFCENGLSEFQNGVRNFVFHTLEKADRRLLASFLHQCESPLLFAEHLARIMHEIPDINEKFFACDRLIQSLGANISKLRNTKENELTAPMRLARNVIYSNIFALLNDTSMSLLCFSSDVFSSTFTLLVFDRVVKEAVLGCIKRTLAVTGKLPEALRAFLVSFYLFAIDNCEDESTVDLALMMTSSIFDGVMHNSELAKSCAPILPHLMKFTSVICSAQTLGAVLTLYTLCLRDNVLLKTERSAYFCELVNLLRTLGKGEQQEAVLGKLVNCIADSTILQSNHMFLIRVPEMIPVVVFVTAGTRRFIELIELFRGLCHFSERNSLAFIDAGLPVLLLGCLGGNMEYLDTKISVTLSEDEKSSALKFMTDLLSVGTSSAIETALYDLVKPNEEHKYLDCALDVLNMIGDVVEAADRKTYPVCFSTPLLTVDGYESANLTVSFCVAFWVKIDTAYVAENERTYILFQFEDENNVRIQISYHNGGLLFKLIEPAEDADVVTTRCLYEFPSETKWNYFTVTINKQTKMMMLYVTVDFGPQKMLTFPHYEFGTNVTLSVGFVNQRLACDEYCPVVLGDFALIDLPYSDVLVETLSRTGLDVLNEFKNVRVTSMTHKVRSPWSRIADRTFTDGLCERLDAGRWLTLFQWIESSPKYYLERLVSLCLKLYDRFTARLCISFEDRMTTWMESFSRLSGIDISRVQAWNSTIDFSDEAQPSMIGAIVGYLARQNALSLSLYKAIWGAAEKFPRTYSSILFNLFLWNALDSTALRRIFVYWVDEIGEIVSNHHLSLFESLLVQMHVLASHSCRNVQEIRNWRLRILEQVLVSDFQPSYYNLVLACLANSDKSEDVVFYIELLNRMPERQMLDPQGLYVQLCSIVTKAGPTMLPLLYDILSTSGRCDISAMENQLAVHFLLVDSSFEVPQKLTFKCIQAVSSGHIDNEMLIGLSKWEVSTGALWPVWPIITAIVQPETAPILSERIVDTIRGSGNFMHWFECVLDILDVCDAKDLGSSTQFRKLFICGLCKRLIFESRELIQSIDCKRFIIRSMFSIFFRFTPKTHSSRLLELFDASPFKGSFESTEAPTKVPRLVDVLTLFQARRACRFMFEPGPYDGVKDVLRDLATIRSRNKVVFSDQVGEAVGDYLDHYLESGEIQSENKSVFPLLLTELSPLVCQSVCARASELEVVLESPGPPDVSVDWHMIERVIKKECFGFLVLLSTDVQRPFERKAGVGRFVRFCIPNRPRRYRATERYPDLRRNLWEVRVFIDNELVFSLLEIESSHCVFRTGDLKQFYVIRFENIKAIIAPIGGDYIEIFGKHCDSVRVKSSREKINEIANKFEEYSVHMIRNSEERSLFTIEKWATGLISNWHLILALNFLNGRSFNSTQEILCPEDFPDLKDALQCSAERFPEYYDALHKAESTYISRDWFNATFHFDLPERQVSTYENPNPSKISFGVQFKNVFFGPRVSSIYYETPDGEFHYAEFDLETEETNIMEVLPFDHGSRFIPIQFRNELRLYDMDLTQVHMLMSNRVITRETSRCRLGPYCVCDNVVFFVLNESSIAVSPVTGFPIDKRVMVYENENILTLACTPDLDVLAYVVDSGKIKIVSAPDGDLVGSIRSPDWEIRRLIVTDNWCFVCVETDKEMVLLNKRGQIVSRTQKNADVRCWMTFSRNVVDDYLVVFDASGDVRLFPAADITQSKVLAHIEENIMDMKLVYSPLGVIAVSQEGNVFTIPLCL